MTDGDEVEWIRVHMVDGTLYLHMVIKPKGDLQKELNPFRFQLIRAFELFSLQKVIKEVHLQNLCWS